MKLKCAILFFIIVIVNQSGISQESWHKWYRFSGEWIIKDSKAVESHRWGPAWNMYELINYNSIVSIISIDDLSSMEVNAELFDRLETPSEFMISFAVTSESQKWYYHIYAFKITGGFWGMNKASFIFSDRLDKTKPLNSKKNIFINELASTECKIKYNKTYNYRISFEGSDVVLYINDKKILSTPFPEKKHDGRIAISSRNIKISLDKVVIKQKDKVIFEDDFEKDSIFVKTIKATREVSPKVESTKNPE